VPLPGYDDLVAIPPGQAVMVAGVVFSFEVRGGRLVAGARLASEPAARRAGLDAERGEISLIIAAAQDHSPRSLRVPGHHEQSPPTGGRPGPQAYMRADHDRHGEPREASP
jgi:hypothetical protein